HAFEVEGHELEKSLPLLQPGKVAELRVDLPAGRYETYCPVGKNSHKMLSMINHLSVSAATRSKGERASRVAHDVPAERAEYAEARQGHEPSYAHHMESHEDGERESGARAKVMHVAGGGPGIQI